MGFPLTGTGLWSSGLRYGDPGAGTSAAAELDALGYSALFVPDVGGDLFPRLEGLLAATSKTVIATGILNLWMHEAEVASAQYASLTGQFGDRLLIGIGVSHAPLIDMAEAGRYRKPFTKMTEYLDQIDATSHPIPPERRVLAALGPKMLELARTRTAGTHPYLVTPDHTAATRKALGNGPLIAAEQAVVLESDPSAARSIARLHLATYLSLPNYSNNWRRQGFDDADFDAGGSDRLVDALVAWGDEAALSARVDEHRSAGADHVCLQVLTADPLALPLAEWRRLAPVFNS